VNAVAREGSAIVGSAGAASVAAGSETSPMVSANEAGLRANFLSLAATRQRHVGSNPNPETLDPDRWTDEFAFLSRPGEADIQIDLFYDYRTNVANYLAWSASSSKPIHFASGTISRANSSCFAGRPFTYRAIPVTLPPGRASLPQARYRPGPRKQE
jgi:hypothetical protein